MTKIMKTRLTSGAHSVFSIHLYLVFMTRYCCEVLKLNIAKNTSKYLKVVVDEILST
jgi:hypothetical protein